MSNAKDKTAKKPSSKVDFVRSLPSDMKASEVVEKAEAEGITLSENYVYKIRMGTRAGGKVTGKRRRRGAGRPAATAKVAPPKVTRRRRGVSASAGAPSSVEDLFLAVVSEIGISRALEILQSQQAKVRALLGR